jgi:ring-1,2-phenylacetyl-CoA epoxidase subunit PaaA
MMSAGEREAQLLARIARGDRIESREDMTDEYRQCLVHLMTMQADSELAGGYGYVPWITKAPGVEEKHVVAQIVKDEIRHATVMYGLLADLGVDVAAHVAAHDDAFTMRIAADADIGTQRIAADKRVNIFYYPIDTWADFIFFNFCMDRGAGHQLEDVRGCSYGPWARAIEGIFKEETFHIRHGEHWVKRLAQDPRTREEAQRTFGKWYVRTMNIFGRPGSAKNALYRKYRLKLRDNDEVRAAFAAEVKEKAETFGLTVPDLDARVGSAAGGGADTRVSRFALNLT